MKPVQKIAGKTKFTAHYRGLNDRQREAVDAIDGPVMVTAGPGTGKTKILTLRIANIIAKTDTPPEAILALTFTESGASEMKERLASLIGQDAYRVQITTFHSFCNEVIQEYPESFGLLAGAVPLAETDQATILQELISTTDELKILRPVNAPDLYLHAATASINTLKREGITPERLLEIADAEQQKVRSAEDLYHEKGAHKGTMKGVYIDRLKHAEKMRELAILYERYQAELRSRRAYDYNDMVLETANALERDKELRLMLQEQYQYLLVDEHQDTNNAQNRVIELLASFWERPNLFIVGDAKQAIYRFQGASLENFLYFKSLYSGVKNISLEQNYRSSQAILDAAHCVRPSDGDGLRAQTRRNNVPLIFLELSSPDMHYWAVAKHIKQRIADGTAPEEIAVLARDNNDAHAAAEFLERLGIKYALSSKQDVFADPHIHQLLLILHAVCNYGDAASLYRALHAPVLAIHPLDTYKLMEFCRRGENPYSVARSVTLMRKAGIDDAGNIQKCLAQLAAWSRMVRQPIAAKTLETIVRESGLLASLAAGGNSEGALEKLHELYDQLKSRVQRDRSLTLFEFVEHLEFLRLHKIPLTATIEKTAPGRVRVMTAHKSKGMEFDYVYIIDCSENRWGTRTHRSLLRLPQEVFLKNTRHAVQQDADDEERNLFYVALTRARREVVITMSRHDHNGTAQLPARYISDIPPALVCRPDIAEYEREWARHSKMRFEASPARTAQSEEKAYLNDLFLKQGLSVTALNHYLACPWEYFYTSLLRIPEAPSVALMFGNAVDRALQAYFDRFAKGTRGTKAHLLATFEKFLRCQPLQKTEFTAALARGRTALGGYFDRYHAQWHPRIINQLHVPAVALDDRITLTGRIDKIEFLDASGSVSVVDYKTGAPKSRGAIAGTIKNGNGNYLRQLVFYKLLLDRWQKGKYKMNAGILDFVEPDAKGKWHREEFAITTAHVSELEDTIRRVADEILSLAFWEKRCDDRACQYCKLRNVIKTI